MAQKQNQEQKYMGKDGDLLANSPDTHFQFKLQLYIYRPQFILENQILKIVWDTEIEMDHLVNAKMMHLVERLWRIQ